MGPLFRPSLFARTRFLARRVDGTPRRNGQVLVEFALVVPLLVVLVLGLIEFSLAFNATLSVNQASQNGALTASEAGNQTDADCLILRSIEADMMAPTDRRKISSVEVQWTHPVGGGVKARNTYTRSGSMACPIAGQPYTLPYTRSVSGYLPAQRCNVINGCAWLSPAHSSVDNIGVQIRYTYAWVTPVGALMEALWGNGNQSTGYTFQKVNIFRLEPVL